MQTEPTDVDRARDLAADLELCERAAKGPWHAREVGHNVAFVVDRPPDDGRPLDGTGGHILATVREDIRHPFGWRETSEFLAAARTGWPAALRRAMAAEALVRRHEEAAADYRRDLADASRRLTEGAEEMKRLRAELDRWRRVAELATEQREEAEAELARVRRGEA